MYVPEPDAETPKLGYAPVSVLTRFRRIANSLDPAARRLRAELRRVAATLPIADRVLDLGSGQAPYAAFFPHRNYFTADLLTAADVRCEAAHLPFPNESFDLIICTEVLEHVPDPAAALNEMRRTLRSTGALVLSTPLTWGVHEQRDFHRWTDSGLRQLLSQHGFTVKVLRSRGGILVCLGALLLVIPWQLFGEGSNRRRWQSALFAASYLLLFPIATVIAALDPLDSRQHFTHGYVAQCGPSEPSPGV
jgi:SAM-dependent methyltransferase